MVTTMGKFPDHGDEKSWIKLEGEHLRCYLGLRMYYTKIEGQDERTSMELAWVDLKKEFPELSSAPWFIE